MILATYSYRMTFSTEVELAATGENETECIDVLQKLVCQLCDNAGLDAADQVLPEDCKFYRGIAKGTRAWVNYEPKQLP